MSSGQRFTLDVAHVVDGAIIRRHIVCLSMTRAIELEYAERLNPGQVYSERSDYVPGDKSWAIEYPDRLARRDDLVA